MAVKYECDRCGKQWGTSGHLTTIIMQRPDRANNEKEICGDCLYVIEKALLPPAKPKPE